VKKRALSLTSSQASSWAESLIWGFSLFSFSRHWDLAHTRQVFYHLSYTPSPFVLVLILKQGLITTFPGLASNLRSSCLYFLSIWDYRHEPLCLAFVLFLRPESH
jgi:hypothetical protein